MQAGCANLWLEDFTSDFDAAASALLHALGVRRAALDELRRIVRRAGRLSPAQVRSLRHTTYHSVTQPCTRGPACAGLDDTFALR